MSTVNHVTFHHLYGIKWLSKHKRIGKADTWTYISVTETVFTINLGWTSTFYFSSGPTWNNRGRGVYDSPPGGDRDVLAGRDLRGRTSPRCKLAVVWLLAGLFVDAPRFLTALCTLAASLLCRPFIFSLWKYEAILQWTCYFNKTLSSAYVRVPRYQEQGFNLPAK